MLEKRRLLSGVTLITHGQGGGGDDEAVQLGNLIADIAGGAAQYKMTVSSDNVLGAKVTNFERRPDSPDIADVASGERIIFIDWTDANVTPTTAIAEAVAKYMTDNGLVEQELHLAGPSRGASVMSNLAGSLGERGVWVDHVTYIDPVPAGAVLPGIGDVADGPMRVTENVIFADDYWRSDNNVATGFDGQPVDGAHNVSLNNTVQADHGDIDPHTGAGLYYISTVDPSGPLAPGARSSWFGGDNPDRDETGYVFSRIVGGVRPVDGIGANFGGAAHRDSVDEQGAQWANIAQLGLRGGVTSVPRGKSIQVAFRFNDVDSKSTVSIFLDKDQNPYNANTVSRIARRTYNAAPMAGARLSGTTVEAPNGKYFVYAQIADSDGHVRYAYLRDQLTITTPPSSLNFVTSKNGTIDVAGTSGDDRIYVTTDSSSIGATLHDFTQIVSLTGVNSIRIHGGAGDDRLVLGLGVTMALVQGEAGNDTLIGADGDDRLEGGGGHDQLYGNGGDDRLSGGGSNDYLSAGSGSDRLYGDAGNDFLVGGAGNDRLFGGSGSDVVDGNDGTDRADNDPLDQFSSVEILFG